LRFIFGYGSAEFIQNLLKFAEVIDRSLLQGFSGSLFQHCVCTIHYERQTKT